MARSNKVFVLQAGINTYHPESGVGALEGAVNDVNAMGAWLEANLPANRLEKITLTNEQATHAALTHHFRNWLAKEARPGDTVLFEYSGHGSRELAPDAFKTHFHEGMNETLVAYDSRKKGGFDLADKELAVLLSLIPAEVHLVVMADSCHSGSITRSAALETRGMARWTPDTNEPRPLESYADGYYADLLKQQGRMVIPAREHVSLSACSRYQLAYESDDHRGYFTTALLEVLDRTGGRISYADLFVKVRQAIKALGVKQDPQFEYTAGTNPWLGWLNGAGGGKPQYASVFFEDNKWKIDRGAVHGLQGSTNQVPVFSSETSRKADGIATLTNLGVQTSFLDASALKLDPKKTYFGAIPVAPMPVFFGSDFLKGTVKDLFEKEYTSALQSVGAKEAGLHVKKSEQGWGVYEASGKFLTGIETTDAAAAAKYLFDSLEKFAAWQRILSLENPRSLIKKEELGFRLYEVDESYQEKELKGDVLEVDFWEENGEPKPFWYSLKAENKSARGLYFTLVYLGAELDVQVHYQDKALQPSKGPEVVLSNDRALGIVDPKKTESVDRFLLIGSTEPLDAFLFEQTGVETWGTWRSADGAKAMGTRSLFKREPAADWQVKMIEVRTVRRQGQQASGAFVAGGARITVGDNPPVEAQVSVASPSQLDPEVRQWMEKLPGVTGMGVGAASRSTEGGIGVLELQGLKGDTTVLDRPIDLRIEASLKKGEYLLPITYDGQHFMPAGLVTARDKGTLIVGMNELHPDTVRTRSLGKAVKTYFLKVNGKSAGVSLRQVVFTKDGLHQTSDGLEVAVKKANKILVVLHGIIGNTADQVAGLKFAITQGKYDLMLSFDYENLGTPISETAKTLKEMLMSCGAAEKGVDLLAHSMGGLVSRWMIEKEGGDVFVNKLFMLGTPNSGSAFSNMAPVINVLIALAANMAHPGLGGLVAFSQAFGKYNLTRTLADMDKDSKILHELNLADPFLTEYTIVAGDISKYKPANDGGFFQNFMSKALSTTGRLIYKKPNDVAVSVESILNVNQGQPVKSFTVDCNHLVYFSEPNSTNLLRKIM